ncbi:MAG: MFS transporter [Steroidobacteraceae bacterium]
MSLLSDYFPPERRAKAIGFVQLSTISGAVLGLMVGGYITQYYGWRTTFVMSGSPGLLIAGISWLALRDPRARQAFAVPNTGGESALQALRALIGKPSFIYATLALTAFMFLADGPLLFDAAYTIRVLHVGIAESGLALGALSLGYIAAGNLIGGALADRLSKRDIAWLCKIPGYGMLMIFPFYAAAHLAPSLAGYTIYSAIAGTIMFGILPSLIASLLAVVGARRRATGYAFALMVSNLVGVTSGPVVTGMLSDHLAHSFGPAQGLRWSIILMLLAFIPTGWFMLRAARTIRADFEI